MLPGVSGTLLASTFLERVLDEDPDVRDRTAALRSLLQWWRRVQRTLGPASSVRAIADVAAIPFFEDREFHVLHLERHGDGLVGSVARTGNSASCVVLTITPWEADADLAWRDTVRAGRVLAARWGIIFNGHALRIVDAHRCWSRRAVDFRLAHAMVDERSAAALLSIMDAIGHARTPRSLDALIARAERHGVDVCASLGVGVLDALTTLFTELQRAQRNMPSRRDAYEQAVTLVYRLLFLLFAEARAMVPHWHQVYRDSYTIDSLCRRALTQPRRRGFWKSLQAISRLAHDGCRAGDLVVTPFNGRLFSPRHTPLAECARVSDEAVRTAVISLATRGGVRARERIAYGDLGVEQLGSVYEKVLEYEPAASGEATSIARTSHARKSSGTFYTPRSITDFLVRRVLHPLVQGRTSEQILTLRVLDPAMGSGAFLVSACRYLSAAVERALIEEGTLHSDCSRHERMDIRRRVAQRCLYGVDCNPMAVQLARLSLWLASLSADRPLTFLDHHLAVGDSLLGATVSDLARAPGTAPRESRRPSMPLLEFDTAGVLSQQVLPQRFRLAHDPDDTPAAVGAKERLLAQLSGAGSPLARWKAVADLWCAAWFWNRGGAPGAAKLSAGIYHDVAAALTGATATLPAHQQQPLIDRVREIASARRFFHWELEFPEAFFGADGRRDPAGGFDVVIGNPPWDMLRADLGDHATREHARDDVRATLRFFRDSRTYRWQGRGHANRYQLFVERSMQLVRPGGRVALIVPGGLASDQGSADLRRALLGELEVDRLLGFDNRAGIFPIHRDMRFLLLTATRRPQTDRVTCTLGLNDAGWLDQLPDAADDDPPSARRIAISRATLNRWDPKHLALPWLTTAADYDILSQVASQIAVLGDPGGWDVTFGRELNATDDRAHFVRRHAADDELFPIVEGKHLEPFRALTPADGLAIHPSRALRLIDPARSFNRSRLAYRDVASATNRLTLIAARLPAGTLSTHTVFCSRDALGVDAQYCLLSLLNSLVANYLVRLRVMTHVTTSIMALLPVPRPATASREFRELVAHGRTLESTGVEANVARYARLNAIAARLYGLTAAQYEHVVGTFPLLAADLRTRLVASYHDALSGLHGRATETQRTQR